MDINTDSDKNVLISNSNFDLKHVNPKGDKQNNVLTNAHIVNSKFELSGKTPLIFKKEVIFENNVIKQVGDFYEPQIVLNNEKSNLKNVTIKNAVAQTEHALISIESASVTIDDIRTDKTCSMSLLEGTISGLIFQNSEISEIQSSKENNKLKYFINFNLIQPTDSGRINVEFTDCIFNKNQIPVFGFNGQLVYNATIGKCVFTNNQASKGSCICIIPEDSRRTEYKLIIKNNTFSGNINGDSDSNYVGGALHITTVDAVFEGNNYFYKNEISKSKENAFGASIHLIQIFVDPYTIENAYFEGDYSCFDAGSLFIHGLDADGDTKNKYVTIKKCTFVNCEAKNNGGAISSGRQSGNGASWNNDIKIEECHFTSCHAKRGGAIYIYDGTEMSGEESEIIGCYFTSCYLDGQSGCDIYCASYELKLSGCHFLEHNKTYTENDVLIELKVLKDTKIESCFFEKNAPSILRVIDQSSPNDLTFSQCHFNNNQIIENDGQCRIFDLSFIQKVKLILDTCEFKSNTGSCIYAKKGICETELKKTTFENNNGIQGCAIYASKELKQEEQISIEECRFISNIVKATKSTGRASGVIYMSTKSVRFVGQKNEFNNNQALFEGESDSEYTPSFEVCAYGGTLFIEQYDHKEYTFSDLTITNSYSTHYGGAIGVLSADYEGGESSAQNLFITFENCKFTNCSSGIHGGAIKFGTGVVNGKESNDVKISICEFSQCISQYGGCLYFVDGSKEGDEETILYKCTFDGTQKDGTSSNIKSQSGTALYCRSYKFSMSDCTFKNYVFSGSKDEGVGGSLPMILINLNENGLTPRIEDCTFRYNKRQHIEFHSGKPGSYQGSSIEFFKCTFNFNNKDEDDESSVIRLDQIASQEIKFEKCIFDQNGGQCIRQATDQICNSHLLNCNFTNNHGHDGSCIYIIEPWNAKNNYKTKIEGCLFKGNKGTNTTAGTRGCVSVDTHCVEFVGKNEFIDNQVLGISKTSDDEESYSYGGSLFIRQEVPDEFIVSGLIFTNSYSQNYGGAIGVFSGDHEGGESEISQLFVTIENCVFTNCTAGKHGGAIKCGTGVKNANKNNDIKLSHCEFSQCYADIGGCLFFTDGTKDGDEETVIEYCRFDGQNKDRDRISTQASALYTRSYKFEMRHTIFENYNNPGDAEPSMFFLEMNENEISPVIENVTFYNNEQFIELQVGRGTSDTGSGIDFIKCNFTKNNQDKNGEQSILQLDQILSQEVRFESCIFDQNGGQCIRQGVDPRCNSAISNCNFTNNHGIDGCAIYTAYPTEQAKFSMVIGGCLFKGNKSPASAKTRGCVSIDTHCVLFQGRNEFIDNQVLGISKTSDNEESYSYGGSLFIRQEDPASYFIRNMIFTNSYCRHYGGAIGVFSGDHEGGESEISQLFVTIENCVFTNCTAGKHGGAIKCGTGIKEAKKNNDVKISNCEFSQCYADIGGCLFFTDGTKDGDEETVIEYCRFDGQNKDRDRISTQASALYTRSYKFEMRHTIFENYNNPGDAEPSMFFLEMNENEISPVIENVTFYNNEQFIELQVGRGTSDTGSGIDFIKCNFIKNNQDKNGEQSILQLDQILSQEVRFESCIFDQNGGQCIRQGVDPRCNSAISNCNFTNNHGIDGCAIYTAYPTEQAKFSMVIGGCLFKGNKSPASAKTRGCVSIDTHCVLFQGRNEFIDNQVLGISKTSDNEESYSYGGSLFIRQEDPASYFIRNMIFTNSYCRHYGGAIGVFSGDHEGGESEISQLFVTIENCVFTNCTAGKHGGAIKCGTGIKEAKKNNDVKISNCEFSQCYADIGGCLFFTDGTKDGDEETVIEYCRFDGQNKDRDRISTQASALYTRSYKFEMRHTIFENYNNPGDAEPSMFFLEMNENGVSPIIDNCTFYNNEQFIESSAGVGVVNTGSSIQFVRCNFTKNNQNKDDEKGVIRLDQMISQEVKFDSCIFDQNGGQCIRQANDPKCNSYILNCNFTNNHGHDGSCIYIIEPWNAKNNYKTKIEGCLFKGNKGTNTAGTRGCVSVDTHCVEFVGKNEFIDNEIQGISGTNKNEESYSYGGSLFIRQEVPDEFIVSGLIFTNSYSKHYGGAIGIFAGDYVGGESAPQTVFVTIKYCIFKNCTAGKHGGAIKCGTGVKNANKNNDVKLSHCEFSQCYANIGGCLFFTDGTKDGDEETVIEYCRFDGQNKDRDRISTQASALYTRSYKFEMRHTIFENYNNPGDAEPSMFFLEMNENEISPVIENVTFYNNEQFIELQVGRGTSDTGSGIDFIKCNFTKNNQDKNGEQSILQLDQILSQEVRFESCIFDQNGGQCIRQGVDPRCNSAISNCNFTNNHGIDGCAIYTAYPTEQAKFSMVIGGCLFKGNKSPASAKTRGCVSIDTHCVLFQGRNEFIDNQVLGISKTSDNEESYSYGGSLFIRQEDPASYFIRNMIFTNSYCRHYGGAIGVFSGDHEGGESEISQLFVTIENCVFTNCTAGKHGGAIKCGTGVKNAKKNNDVKLSHCEFSQCYANIGGCLFFTDGTKDGDEETVIEYCRFDGQNKDTDRISTQASALYTRSYKFEMRHTIFENYNNPGDAEPSMFFLEMNENEISPVIENVTFYNNEQFIELQVGRGTSDTGSGIDFIKCNFIKNNQDKNGEQSILQLDQILSQEVRFESCIFDQNGGQCIRQGVDPRCNSAISNCNFTNNHGIDGCAIYTAYPTEQAKFSMVIGGCLFKGNKSPASAKTRGCVSIDTHCVLFQGRNEFIDNQVLGISKTSDNEESYSYGGSLFIRQEDPASYFIRNMIFTNSYCRHYGGAIGVFSGDHEGGESEISQLFVTIENCVFTNCTAGKHGGAIKCGTGVKNAKKNNDVKLSHCEFSQCYANIGGCLFFTDGTKDGDEETVIEYCRFDGQNKDTDRISTQASALYTRSYKFEMRHTIFENYNNPGDAEPSMFFLEMNENEISPVIENVTFYNNEQFIELQVGRGTSDTGSGIDFIKCNFTKNNQDKNGEQSILQLDQILSQEVRFESCIFDQNGGQCIRQGVDPRCNSAISNCNFTNNHGIDGCAIYTAYPTEQAKFSMVIGGCLFKGNKSPASAKTRGCVSIDTHCVLFQGRNEFIDNQVLGISKTSDNEESYSYGGSLFIRQEDPASYFIRNMIFTNSYCRHYGGAIGVFSGDHEGGESEISQLFVTIENCVFTNCTAGKHGGAIKCGTGVKNAKKNNDVKLSHCEFSQCYANIGGCLFFTDGTKDGDEETVIEYCRFDGQNKDTDRISTQASALYTRSYKFEMRHTIFENYNNPGDAEPSMFFLEMNENEISPVIENVTFYNNEQFIELQVGRGTSDTGSGIDFIKCNFIKNNQDKNGEQSILQLDQILSQEVRFESCIFDQNGGQCIRQGVDPRCNSAISNCNFTNNHGIDGCAIYTAYPTEQAKFSMVIGGCLFKGNKSPASAKTRGCVSIDTHCVLFQGRNEFIDNQVLGISKTSDNEESYSYGGSLFIRQEDPASYFIRNMIFTNSYCRHYGGAIGVFSGDHEGGESEISQLFVTIENCVFTNCTAGKHGGAIKCGTGVKNAKKNNDVKLSHCEFSQCYANIGGCLFFTDGTKDGDEETVIEYCRFDGQNKDRDRISTQASALYTRSYKFEMRHTIFENYNNPGDAEPSMFFLEMNENEISPVIENVTFYNNEQFIELQVGRGTSDTGSGIDFIKCNFTKNNQDKNGEQSILQLDQILSQEVRFESCIFDQNGGQCIRQGVDPRCNSAISNCNFTNNHGIDGCAIYTAYPTEQAKFSMVIGGCLFKGNKSPASAKTRGCVSIDTHCVLFQGRNEFIDNQVLGISKTSDNEESYSYGGSLFIRQEDPASYFIRNMIFTNSYCRHYGGAIGVFSGDHEGGESEISQLFVTIENCVFTNCTAGKHGGAIKCGTGVKNAKKNNDVKLSHCEFSQCYANIGGCLFFTDGTKDGDEETVIEYCRFDGQNKDTDRISTQASALYTRSYKFEMRHTIFENYNNPGDAEPSMFFLEMNENEISPVIENVTFYNNEQFIELQVGRGTSDTGSGIDFIKCNFIKNNQDKNGEQSILQLDQILSQEVRFESCIFDQNGGQCIRQGVDPRCNSAISNCNFTNNHGIDGCAIYTAYPTEQAKFSMVIGGCLFKGNKSPASAKTRGCVSIDTHCVLFQGRNEFIDNQVLGISKTSDNEESYSYGGSLFIRQEDPASYFIRNMIFTNSYCRHYGGAIGVFSGDHEGGESEISQLFVTIENCVFTNCTAGKHGGAIKCGTGVKNAKKNNDVKLSHCEFSQCYANIGGCLFFTDGTKDGDEETVIEYCRFDGQNKDRDRISTQASALYTRSYKFEMRHTIFENYNNPGDAEPSMFFLEMNENEISPVIENVTFYNNEQFIELQVGRGTSDTGSGIDFIKCNFTKNNQDKNGEQSILQLDQILSQEVRFESCIFDQNGGQCIRQGVDPRCNSAISNCNFTNNHGIDGCAIYTAYPTEQAKFSMVIGGCLFKGNKSPASAKTRGCVSIDTHCVLFQGRNEFIDNQVLGISKTSDNEESYSYGGSLFIRQEDPASYFIRNMIFTNSYCRHYGGAIGVFSGDHEGGESEISQLFVTIENCVFTNCTAGKHGGAIKCGTGVKNAKKNNDVKISNCEFSQCYADIGGCLFFTDGTKDGDEETVIEYCRFDGQNKDRDRISTQASALYTRSYKFEMRHTIFENYNNPGDAEPSMFFLEMNENEISPVIENVTFYNNEQFIELQVGRGTSDTGSGIDFIKCNFTKNNQDKNGEQSILQLDQILSQEVRFESCIFDQNGGQCIRQGVDPRCNSAILNCNFTNNHGIDGCAIYTAYPTEQAKFSMVIGGCLFKGNKSPASAKTRGCVSIDTHCVLFNGHNEFIDNEILGISGKSENDESYSCGGSLFIRQEDPAEYFVTDVTFTNSYSKHYGGAIGVYAGDYEGGASSPKQLFITITKCVFNNCTSYNRGGAIKCGTGIKNDGKKNNDVKITYCVFNQCDSMTGGSLFFSDGTKEGDEETVIEYCQFNGITNTSLSKGTSGSAIYCRSYKFELSHSTFTNYKGPSSFISCILNENNLQPKVTNCTFSKSEQRIDFESGEGVTGTGSSIIFSNCHFTENTGDLENGLGVIQNEYIKSEIVTFDKCVFDKNKGQSIRQGDDPRCNTFIVKCNFTNNVGTDGCAIYVIYPYKKPNYKIIIQDCLFMKNRATGPSGLRGCVRIDTHCVEFRGHNQFISNEIILTKKAAADNNSTGDAAIGGSLFINQEDQAEYTLSGLTFTNSYSGQNGGAIGIYAGDYSRSGAESKLFISVYNCVFNNCSCKNNGGAICGSTEGKLGISSCSFNSGKAENGADIYYIDTTKETPSNVTIRNCYFSNGQATNAGGAIYSVADSVFVDFCNFTGCNAKTNGAIMFIESQSNFSLENNIINYSSNAAVPAISYNGTTENATIWFDGGCISKSETSKNHFISLYSNVTIQFKSKPCFQGSKEDTFEFAANANVQSLPDEYFNCHECDNIVIVPPSINPTDLPFSPTLDPNATAPYQPGGNDNKKKKKGLSTGAIVGIVIGVIAFVALVAVGIILLIIWKKRNPRDVRSEQVSSQEVETGIYNLGGQSQSDFNTDNNPIWQATNDINDDGPEDPFMKNFEESDI